MVGFFGDRFSLHHDTYIPVAGFRKRILKFSAKSIGTSKTPACAKENHVTPEKICFLFIHVSEIWHHGLGGPAAIIIFIFRSVISSAYSTPVVLKGNILPEQTIVVPQTIWKPVRSGIQEQQIGVQAGCIHKNDACKKFG